MTKLYVVAALMAAALTDSAAALKPVDKQVVQLHSATKQKDINSLIDSLAEEDQGEPVPAPHQEPVQSLASTSSGDSFDGVSL